MNEKFQELRRQLEEELALDKLQLEIYETQERLAKYRQRHWNATNHPPAEMGPPPLPAGSSANDLWAASLLLDLADFPTLKTVEKHVLALFQVLAGTGLLDSYPDEAMWLRSILRRIRADFHPPIEVVDLRTTIPVKLDRFTAEVNNAVLQST